MKWALKTLVLGISTASTVLLERTTDRNTSLGYHPKATSFARAHKVSRSGALIR